MTSRFDVSAHHRTVAIVGLSPKPHRASFGVAQYIVGESLWDAVKNADTALYLAKHAGKNTVRIENDDGPQDIALQG